MYLYRRQYVGGWEWKNVETDAREKALYDSIVSYFGSARVEDSPHAYVDLCVAYWRKANAIHGWFIENLANGVDECQPINVSYDDLRELRDLAASVVKEPAMAASVLPTQSGFFFGSYEYDEWYMEDMKRTVAQLDEVLAEVGPDTWTTFIYQASW